MHTLAAYSPLIALAALACLIVAIGRSALKKGLRIALISVLLVVTALCVLFVLAIAQVAGTGYN